MAQHILRRDLKKDEIREKMVSGLETVATHQQTMWIVIIAALVVALAVLGWDSYSRRQTAKASLALDDALAAIDCEAEEFIERHSHVIVIGAVRALQVRAGRPLIYSQGEYGALAPI